MAEQNLGQQLEVKQETDRGWWFDIGGTIYFAGTKQRTASASLPLWHEPLVIGRGRESMTSLLSKTAPGLEMMERLRVTSEYIKDASR